MPFYTDLGPEYPQEIANRRGSIQGTVNRYAFWELVPAESKHGVVETGNDINQLMAKYGDHRLVVVPDTSKP